MPVTLTYRAVKGSPLTWDELDANFQSISDWIDDAEANPTPPNGIANIVQEGSVITFYLDNSDSFAVTLPTAPAIIPFVEKSANSFTLSINDRNTMMNCTHVDGCEITIPLDDDSNIPLHAEFHFRQDGFGAITFNVPTDVEVKGIQGLLDATNRGGAVFTLKHTNEEDVWVIFGLLTDDVSAT